MEAPQPVDFERYRSEALIYFTCRNLPQGGHDSMTTPAQPYMPPCAICGKPCDLETCKADWMGKAVHEECLAKAIAPRKPQPS